MKRFAFAAPVILLLGCHKDIQNTAAVRQGIVDYLANKPGLNAMDVNVTSVSFRSNEADATVYFQAKGMQGSGNGMQMRYLLERKGDRWTVKNRADSGGNPHPGVSGDAGTTLPPGHPGLNGGGSSALPPGHPAVPNTGLPPGHPPLPQASGPTR